jgi:hypothetical protein
LWGRDDKLAPASAGRRLAREISGAHFEVFDCGHSPAEETPDEVARAIVRFGAGASSAAATASTGRRSKAAAKPGAKSKTRKRSGGA